VRSWKGFFVLFKMKIRNPHPKMPDRIGFLKKRPKLLPTNVPTEITVGVPTLINV
jgi:hypothetical protein